MVCFNVEAVVLAGIFTFAATAIQSVLLVSLLTFFAVKAVANVVCAEPSLCKHLDWVSLWTIIDLL
jgi:hypothetical protein